MLPENIHQPIIFISFVYVQWYYDTPLASLWPYATVNDAPCCTRTVMMSLLQVTTTILMWRNRRPSCAGKCGPDVCEGLGGREY